jgi:hypothetical protein
LQAKEMLKAVVGARVLESACGKATTRLKAMGGPRRAPELDQLEDPDSELRARLTPEELQRIPFLLELAYGHAETYREKVGGWWGSGGTVVWESFMSAWLLIPVVQGTGREADKAARGDQGGDDRYAKDEEDGEERRRARNQRRKERRKKGKERARANDPRGAVGNGDDVGVGVRSCVPRGWRAQR